MSVDFGAQLKCDNEVDQYLDFVEIARDPQFRKSGTFQSVLMNAEKYLNNQPLPFSDKQLKLRGLLDKINKEDLGVKDYCCRLAVLVAGTAIAAGIGFSVSDRGDCPMM